MDLSVNYLGLKLKNPIIIGSSELTNTVDKITDLEQNGAAAVVLKSLFEEQIAIEAEVEVDKIESDYPEAIDYIKTYSKERSLDKYINLIKQAKSKVKIPIIASINCVTSGKWIEFAKKIENAGADAIEINISLLPSDSDKTSNDNEKIYFEITKKLKKTIKIPIALKMSHYSAGLANLIKTLSWTKNIDSFVLFNRYYSPDIDIDNMEIIPAQIFSSPNDITDSLRWIFLLSNKIETDIAASTGIHSGKDVIKQLLAGATAVQVVSAIYEKGPKHIYNMIDEIKNWMQKNKFNKITDFQSKINDNKDINIKNFERIQFMKYFGNIK